MSPDCKWSREIKRFPVFPDKIPAFFAWLAFQPSQRA
jgi:hypothetical protein